MVPATGPATERTMTTPVMDVPAVTEKASVPAASRPLYEWALRVRGCENAGRAEGAIDQCMAT